MASTNGEHDPRVADIASRNWMFAWVVSACLWLVSGAASAPPSKLTAMNTIPAALVQGAVLAAFVHVAVRRGRGELRGAAIACICTYAGLGTAVLAAFAPRAAVDMRLIVGMWLVQLAFAAKAVVALRRAGSRSPASD